LENFNTNQQMDLLSFLETDHRKLIRATEVARILGISLETVYDWKYRAASRKIPAEMFTKISRRLFVRSDLLKIWLKKGTI
jgi:hypothetical protein